MKEYPTVWQRKTMWAALTALFVVFHRHVGASLGWRQYHCFLQPILIPVAIAIILTYLLNPLVTKMCRGGLGHAKR